MWKKLSPAQQQYMDLKQQHKDAILFFRLGDFYEMFYEDAHIAHRVLDITLTARDKKSDNPIPMAGIPHHSSEKYIQKLIQAGYKVALAEQVGTAVPGKIVERQVVEIVTPWTKITNEAAHNFIAGMYFGARDSQYHLAWGDVSLGVYCTRSCVSLDELLKIVLQLSPSEVVVDIDFPERDMVEQYIHDVLQLVVSFHDIPHDTISYIQHLTGTSSLVWYGKALEEWREKALWLLLSYVERMQKKSVQAIHTISYIAPESQVKLDDITLTNLEIFHSRQSWSKQHSLCWVIDTTCTAMWSRLLHDRLLHPIHNLHTLTERLQHISYYVESSDKAKELSQILTWLTDVPRLITKITSRKPSALKVQQLMYMLQHINFSDISWLLMSELVRVWLDQVHIDVLTEISKLLHSAIKDDMIQDDRWYIRGWYNTEIDTHRQKAYHSDALFLSYQQLLWEHTWGVKVKLKFVKNQWYVIEVLPKDVEKFEATAVDGDHQYGYIRRQTLKTGQRYTTLYLEELEQDILHAQWLLQEKEADALLWLIERISSGATAFHKLSECLACIDLSVTHALFTRSHNRCCPSLHAWYETSIVKGRHPVVEKFLDTTQQFIPNDMECSPLEFFHIITWPNMGGKSTYLRQNALIVLLAHAWLYVPAESAKIGLIDGLFARVWSGDALAKNQSTFMTEMLEMSNILHNATEKSFVVLDELGRGTSTYDGVALAKAITVYMCQNIKAKSLFATHYHELTSLADTLDGCCNDSVSVYETDHEVVFLKKVVKGAASKSYGIDVAELAGIPRDVLSAAQEYLKDLESSHIDQKHLLPQQSWFSFGTINDEYKQFYDAVQKRLHAIHLNDITPLEALVILNDIARDYKKKT